jgi:hypothetical protein
MDQKLRLLEMEVRKLKLISWMLNVETAIAWLARTPSPWVTACFEQKLASMQLS